MSQSNGFNGLIGQSQAVTLLQQAISKQRIAPAYLFAGPVGTGRALAARCFSQQLLCLGLSSASQKSVQQRFKDGNHPDFFWVEPTYQHQGQFITAAAATVMGLKRKAPPQIRIEQVREIVRFLSRPPLESQGAVVVIEEAQSMAEGAANALLKTLEEPGRATLILIAPSREALLPTLVSRCQQISFSRLSQADMALVLQQCGAQEVLDYPELLDIAQGSPGKAIAGLTQLQAIPEDLRQRLTQVPQSPFAALDLAKAIAKQLDTQAQLWLIDYLQSLYWQRWQQRQPLTQLEKMRQYLLSYVQPRLAWECTLLALQEEVGGSNS